MVLENKTVKRSLRLRFRTGCFMPRRT